MMRVQHGGRDIAVAFQHVHGRWDVGSKRIQAVTLCRIIVDGKEVGYSAAFCSAQDHFSKEIGRKRALARALKAAGLDANTRTAVWDRYLTRRDSKWMTTTTTLGSEPQQE
jgi:hypothetical protein